MKRNYLIISVLTLVLIISASIPPAIAYFTSYARAEGEAEIVLEGKTEIEENFSFTDWSKRVTITNTEGVDVYVRAKAYAGRTYDLSIQGNNWNQDGDWWYYSDPVAAGTATGELTVSISGIPEEELENANINVAVVYETTPAIYAADGSSSADWNRILDTVTEGGGD